MDATALVRLTPVALNLAPPEASIDWADLGEVRCTDPFFDQTVNRWAGGQPPPRLLRSGLGALAEFEGATECDPHGLIFHMSRCGSTLLSRLLGTMPATLVISEPRPLNALLSGMKPAADPAMYAKMLRCLVRALGCRRFGERFYLLKLSSWNIRHLHLFRLAFPAAKTVFVQRAPAAVMASLRADAPGWMQIRRDPAAAETLIDIPAGVLATLDADQFAAHALASMLQHAREAARHGALVVDYAEFAAAAWTRVAPFLGMNVTANDIAGMQNEARYDAKKAGKRIFTADAPARRPVDTRLNDLADEIVEPVYRELERVRRRQISDWNAAHSTPAA